MSELIKQNRCETCRKFIKKGMRWCKKHSLQYEVTQIGEAGKPTIIERIENVKVD